MIELPLSQGKTALVDDLDAALAQTHKWCAERRTEERFYAVKTIRHLQGQTKIYLHTFLTGWSFVDHINGDGLDNQRSNLRPATEAQNLWNRGPQRNNTSGFKGVHRFRSRWQAEIMASGRRSYLGTYGTPDEAARAYDAAATELHGEFACLNFPALSVNPPGDPKP
jgi:hypothetical protein